MNEAESNEGYTYTRANGTVERAPDIETAHKMCPVLGQMSLEQAGIMLKMGARGRAIAEQKAAENTEVEQADDSIEADMFDMPSIYDELVAPVETVDTAELVDKDIIEVEFTPAEPRVFRSFFETFAEHTAKAVTKEAKVVAEPKEILTSDAKSIVEAAFKEEVITSEVTESEVTQTAPEIKELPRTVEAKEVELKPELKLEVKAEVKEPQEITIALPVFTAEQPAPESTTEITEPTPVVANETEIIPSENVEQKIEAEPSIETFVIPDLVTHEEAIVVVQPEAPAEVQAMPVVLETKPPVAVELKAIEEPSPVETFIPEPYVEQNEDTVEAIQPPVLIEDVPERTAPSVAHEAVEIREPIQITSEIKNDKPIANETPIETIVASEVPALIIETTEAIEEIVAEPIETSPETNELLLQIVEAAPEDEKQMLFVPIIEEVEQTLIEDEDVIEQQVVVAMSTANDDTTPKSKVSKLLGMFATLLHIEYTPA